MGDDKATGGGPSRGSVELSRFRRLRTRESREITGDGKGEDEDKGGDGSDESDEGQQKRPFIKKGRQLIKKASQEEDRDERKVCSSDTSRLGGSARGRHTEGPLIGPQLDNENPVGAPGSPGVMDRLWKYSKHHHLTARERYVHDPLLQPNRIQSSSRMGLSGSCRYLRWHCS
jgi:hypothetical protein